MLNFLDNIPSKAWETVGIVFGMAACVFIAIQLYHEYFSNTQSSLSWFHLGGFVLVYLFWFLYGLRFRHIGVWLPNALATVLQTILLITVAIRSFT